MKDEWKRIKARKEHHCDSCDGIIKKGENYDLLDTRIPKFDDKDNQIGIEFFKLRCHPKELNCYWPDECKKGNHKELYYTDNHPDSRNYGDTVCYCENCGTDLSDIEEIQTIETPEVKLNTETKKKMTRNI